MTGRIAGVPALDKRRLPGLASRPEPLDIGLAEIFRRPIGFTLQIGFEEPVVVVLRKRLIREQRQRMVSRRPIAPGPLVAQAADRAGLGIERDREMPGLD